MYKLPLSADEIRARLEGLPDGWHEIAHDEYDPTSQYAQSGIAVAQAVKQAVEQALTESSIIIDEATSNVITATDTSINDLDDRLTSFINEEITKVNESVSELDNKVTLNSRVFVQDIAPTNVSVGSIWIDTSVKAVKNAEGVSF